MNTEKFKDNLKADIQNVNSNGSESENINDAWYGVREALRILDQVADSKDPSEIHDALEDLYKYLYAAEASLGNIQSTNSEYKPNSKPSSENELDTTYFC